MLSHNGQCYKIIFHYSPEQKTTTRKNHGVTRIIIRRKMTIMCTVFKISQGDLKALEKWRSKNPGINPNDPETPNYSKIPKWKPLAAGMTVCSLKDGYNRIKGRDIAFIRASKNIPEEERSTIVEYFIKNFRNKLLESLSSSAREESKS